jgi:hypothetical protein
MGDIISALTELAEGPAIADLLVLVDISDTTQAASGTTKKDKAQNALGAAVNAQTGTSYTYLTTDFRKLVTHTNAAAIAGTLPQAGATFPAGWFMFVQNRGAGVLTITPTTSTIDGAATLVLNQNEGALIVSDGTNYFTMRGKDTGTAVVGGSPFELVVACSDEDTALVADTGVITFRMPRGVTLTAVRASLKTAAASGTFTVDINEGGSTILSTKITIDATEKTSTTAATPPVISDSALADDAEITIDIDDDASGDATGLKVTLIGTRT